MIDSSLCYLLRGNEVLMMHRTRKKNDMNHDKWIAVGGRFEKGESPEECALREVKEETGLTMIEPQYRGVVTFVNDQYETERMHLFTSDTFTGVMTDCDEGELVWIKKDEIDRLPQWEGDRIFHRLLKEDRFHEFYGKKARVLMLTDGTNLVSFCTYAERDDIPETDLTPWMGFVYTAPEYRGRRLMGRLIAEVKAHE